MAVVALPSTPTFSATISGDPICSTCPPNQLVTADGADGGGPSAGAESQSGDVSYANGTLLANLGGPAGTDIGTIFGQTTDWSNQPTSSLVGGANIFGNGASVAEMPQIYEDFGSPGNTIIVADGSVTDTFKSDGEGGYVGQYFTQDKLSYDSDQYTFVDSAGDTIVFNGFGTDYTDAEKGQFLTIKDVGGNTATAHRTDGQPRVRRTLRNRRRRDDYRRLSLRLHR